MAGLTIEVHTEILTPMHAFDVLGDPVRRRIMDLLAGYGRHPDVVE